VKDDPIVLMIFAIPAHAWLDVVVVTRPRRVTTLRSVVGAATPCLYSPNSAPEATCGEQSQGQSVLSSLPLL
jgi:hypothetical protein